MNGSSGLFKFEPKYNTFHSFKSINQGSGLLTFPYLLFINLFIYWSHTLLSCNLLMLNDILFSLEHKLWYFKGCVFPCSVSQWTESNFVWTPTYFKFSYYTSVEIEINVIFSFYAYYYLFLSDKQFGHHCVWEPQI